MGYLLGRSPHQMACEKPVLVECKHGCGAQRLLSCQSTRQSRCPSCAGRHQTRLRRLVADTLDRRAGQGHSYLLTFTAPGEEAHRQLDFVDWHPGKFRPPCSCHEHLADGLGVWNASAGSRWNHLRTALRRDHPDLEFFRAVEVQFRGALHLHVVAVSPERLDGTRIQDLALAAGFGCSTRVDEITGGDVSRYVTKAVSGYVTKAADAREAVPWVDVLTGEVPDSAPYRLWSASRRWGLTMTAIKHACRDAARRRAERLREQELLEAEGALFARALVEPTAPDPPPPRSA